MGTAGRRAGGDAVYAFNERFPIDYAGRYHRPALLLARLPAANPGGAANGS